MNKENPRKKHRPFLIPALALGALCLNQATRVSVSNYVVEHEKLPEAFDGFRILHISDLHSNKLLCRAGRLAEKVRNLSPDLIVVTGDLVDSVRVDFETPVRFIANAAKICPVYYVPGNHEARIRHRDILFRSLAAAGANLLFDKREVVRRNGAEISITGILDPRFCPHASRLTPPGMRTLVRLRNLRDGDNERYRILLSHRPEFADIYSGEGFDLVFSGHAHGGQWRIPMLGAVYSPGQGLFPEYTGGLHRVSGTEMVVSRGLGNSEFPIRINNPFELVFVTLRHKKTF